MAFITEDRVKIHRLWTKEAIELAMQGKWREAIDKNLSILEHFPGDVEAYNRLGRAYMELGEYALAREAYQKALELDPYNKIAQRNLERLSHLPQTSVMKRETYRIDPAFFIKETGKAGIVKLINLAPSPVVVKLCIGDEVSLKIEGSKLIALSKEGEYIGEVEPRHAIRLISLMRGGNRYSAVVASVDEGVELLIREEYQHPSQIGRPSFPVEEVELARPYIKESLLRYEEEEEEEEEYTFEHSYEEEEEYLE